MFNVLADTVNMKCTYLFLMLLGEQGDWHGSFMVARGGAGVKFLHVGRGLAWFKLPTSSKEGSTWSFLSTCPQQPNINLGRLLITNSISVL